jgi:hypothetical protein
MSLDRAALKESISDTIIATPLTLFLNWFFLSIFMALELSAATISFYMTGIFFCLAIIRKYHVRVWFKGRQKS